ncbi:glycosyltransferase [Heyndrickxia coagulans]|uniref:glycosyltransferase n=1 Tax=Heyndrickxia coagulans TaxID=1398 RepID=UPI002164E401|nr:glycosyltransferase [Heyndrickxia coagulans]
MIFVVLGTQRFPMNRVIDKIDNLIETGFLNKNKIVIQNGHSKNSKYAVNLGMIDESAFNNYIKNSDIVITHGGTSSIIKALRNNKKTIIIPRRADLREHVDNHQFEISDMFKNNGYAEVVLDIEDLKEAIINIEQKEYKKLSLPNGLADFLINDILKL